MEEKVINDSFMSPEINEIAAALSEFQGSIEQPKLDKVVKVKTKSGYEYSFKYADLSACIKASKPLLKANGLAISQIIFDDYLITLLTHKSGQWMKSELKLPTEKLLTETPNYQDYGSAVTYLKRYSYCAMLGIAADNDDDGNLACGNTVISESKEKRLKQALDEVSKIKKISEVTELWNKWGKIDPEMVINGSPFYNALLKKNDELKAKKNDNSK